MPQIEVDKVPHIEVIKWKLEQIRKEIRIAEVLYIPTNRSYNIVLACNDRNCQVNFSHEFLDDLPSLSDSQSSSYWKAMHAKLSDLLIEPIERNGLVPFSVEHLKLHLYEHIRKATESTRHVNKFNVIGRPYQLGSLESFLKVKFTQEERQNAGLAWEELKRQGVILPTYEDLINPEDWVTVARIKPEGGIIVDHLFLSSTCLDMVDLRATLISYLQSKGLKVEYSESPTFASLSTEDAHDICLDKVADTPVFLLIVGQRYGSDYLGKREEYKGFSIVHAELRVATGDATKPLLIFIRESVWHEYRFWKKNRDAKNFDADIKVFEMLEEIDAIAGRKIWIDSFRDAEDLKAKVFERLRSRV